MFDCKPSDGNKSVFQRIGCSKGVAEADMKRWLVGVLLFCLLFSGTEAYGEEKEELALYAQSAVLMDGDTGRVLYGKGEELVRPMASTTKIMTCILALELGGPEDEVEASAMAASQPKVHLGVRKGETYRLKDLLYALMLESYNDAAVMIAEHIGGSVEGFAALMNEKAKALGCEDTYFITPNGLDAKTADENGKERIHSTTAEDLARIMRYCVMQSPKKDEFLAITQRQNYSFHDCSGKRFFQCTNHNALLYSMEGVLSGKTGFTGGAGYSYVGALKSRGRTYIIALLGCGWPPHRTWKWSDAQKLFAYGKEHYERKNVLKKLEFEPIPAEDGLYWEEEKEHLVGVTFGENMASELMALVKEGEEVKIIKRLPDKLKAPVHAGDEIGSVTYILGGRLLETYPLYANKTVEKMTWKKGLLHVLSDFYDQ
jgi:D-alanyl-D-alanine carboxypeptidase (penicillin-binding protein 5/6)